MSKTITAPFLQNLKNADGTLTSSTTINTPATIFTAGANDSVLKSLNMTSTDTSARTVQLFVNVGGAGTDRLIGSFSIPAGAGSDPAVQAYDVMRSLYMPFLSYDAFGNKVMNLKAGTTVKVSVPVALTSAKVIDIFGEAGDF